MPMRLTTVFPRERRFVHPAPWSPASALPETLDRFETPESEPPAEIAAEAAAPAESRAETEPEMKPPTATPSPGERSLLERARLVLEMIKFQHTIFALPFALLGAVLAAGGLPPAGKLFWIVLACVFARSAAMSFNRLHDEPFDRENPRTRGWALPAGLLSPAFVRAFCLACIAGFVLSAAMLNTLALALSPVALLVLLGYSATKRFTSGSHFFLGLALGIAPVGAWVAVRGELLAWTPFLLGVAVVLWTAGFDIIYSLQDVDADRRLGLHSLPVRLGRRRALAISTLCHMLALVALLAIVPLTGLGTFYLLAVAACAWLLYYEQSLITPTDLSRLNTAFFTINGWVSALIFLGGAADLLLAG